MTQEFSRWDAQYSRRLAMRSPSNSRMATSRISLRWPSTRSSNRASHSAMAVGAVEVEAEQLGLDVGLFFDDLGLPIVADAGVVADWLL